MKEDTLLLLDGIINLALGGLLVFFPQELVTFLGVPPAEPEFYANILGGVLVGIGLALLLERRNRPQRGTGLGLSGAIAINLSGCVVLAYWLVSGDLQLPARGRALLWSLVIVLAGLSGLELLSKKKPVS